jgi:hypothetical protein
LQRQLGGKRPHLTDDQRHRLAVKGKALGRKVLGRVAGIVTPDTILRWHRQLIARKILVNGSSLAETELEAITAYLMDASSALYGGADGIFSPLSMSVKCLHLDFNSNRISWEI